MKLVYNTTLSLNSEDKKELDQCKKSGIRLIDIFRRGLHETLFELPMKNILKKPLTK